MEVGISYLAGEGEVDWLSITQLTILIPTGERKDFEVYSCDVSPDGSRLVTAAGGEFLPCSALPTTDERKGH